MQTPVRFLTGLALASMFVAAAQAHPGHESDLPELLRRPFAGLDHLAASLAAGVLAGSFVWLAARQITRSRLAVWSSAAVFALTAGAAVFFG